MNRVCILIFTIIFSALRGQNAYEKKTYLSGNDTLSYKLLKPLEKFSSEKLPLIIFFHGAGERGTDNEIQTNHIDRLILDSLNRNNFPCYFVASQCPKGKKWVDMDWKQKTHKQALTPSWAIALTHKLIDSLKRTLNIDTAKIYVTGLSMGGFATWDYCARYPQEVAAAVPVCGGYDVKCVKKMKAIPFWVFHGAEDKVVPPDNSRAMVIALKKLKANVKYTELPGVKHNAWVDAYKDDAVLKWMFQFKK